MIKVYVYGAREPDQLELVLEQLRLAHNYQNKLVEIERTRRETIATELAKDSAVAQALARAEDAEARLDAEVERVKQHKASQRTRSAPLNSIKEIKAEWKEALAALRAAKSEERVRIAPAIDAIHAGNLEERKAARAACGVYWGTYLLREQAADAARKAIEPPEFKRWAGRGAVGVQISGGLPTDELLAAESPVLRMEILPAERDSRRAQNKRHAIVWIRVQSEEARPVWAKVPIVLHRPLPADGLIKRCNLHRRVTADRVTWEVQFIVSLPEPAGERNTRAAGINTGWRMLPDGRMRVAMLASDDGETRELALPAEVVGKFNHPDSLRAVRDVAFNLAKGRLREWLDSNEHPIWLAEEAETIAHWKSPARLSKLRHAWVGRRFNGDGVAFRAVEAWYHQDRHLWQWESFERAKCSRIRREIYRHWVRSVADDFGIVHIGAVKLDQIVRRPPVEETADGSQTRHNSRIASTSVLATLLKQTARADAVDPSNVTRTCHVCGDVDTSWDAAASIMHTCAACGEEWDQDVNAARNLLRREAIPKKDPGPGRAARFRKNKAQASAAA